MSLNEHRQAFVETVAASLDLADRPEVRDGWSDESSCAGMTVGGLTHHLLNQAVNTARLLDSAPDQSGEVIELLEHYRRAAWVQGSQEGRVDDEVNVQIREGDNDRALVGCEAVLANARQHADRLPELLAAPRDPDIVLIPWQGWALTTDDFLTTRMMELVVHGDDLATSVGLDTPDYPAAAVRAVVGLLSGVAVERHGATAVVRALSRPQRAPATVSAF